MSKCFYFMKFKQRYLKDSTIKTLFQNIDWNKVTQIISFEIDGEKIALY